MLKQRLQFHYLRVWYSFYLQYCVRMDIAFGYCFFDTVFAYYVYYRRILNHAYRIFNCGFSSVVKLALYMKDNFSLSQSLAKHFAVANCKEDIFAHLSDVNVGIQVGGSLLQLFDG
jgi:hypothetical protein